MEGFITALGGMAAGVLLMTIIWQHNTSEQVKQGFFTYGGKLYMITEATPQKAD